MADQKEAKEKQQPGNDKSVAWTLVITFYTLGDTG